MPAGTRRIAAENIALRNQLVTLTRNQKRAPKLTTFERITFGILAGFLSYNRLSRIAIALPSHCHRIATCNIIAIPSGTSQTKISITIFK